MGFPSFAVSRIAFSTSGLRCKRGLQMRTSTGFWPAKSSGENQRVKIVCFVFAQWVDVSPGYTGCFNRTFPFSLVTFRSGG
jgi:hypothetical protein